jgi:amino acid adenylation domain-containing protein
MDIAIIGIAARFPEAENIQQFCRNLEEGKDSVRKFSKERLKSTAIPWRSDYHIQAYLDNIHLFDNDFFNISKAEGLNMDPRQRLLMEVVYEMFENGGFNVDDFSNTNTAVIVGDVALDYHKHAKELDPTLLTGSMSAAIAGRISRYFNLRGTAYMVDTVCSSSLVAVHLAVNEIKNGDADCAIVCGINLNIFPVRKADIIPGINSATGKTMAFSSDADGAGMGEAVVSILLKPLEKAILENDIIHAVIKGSAINQDGGESGSLTAPSSKAQSEVIKKAWRKANIDPSTITYIEAHGTGTKLGDPIEIQGIDMAFREFTSEKKFCAISSVKSNIGHTDSAAGISGLMKAILSLKTKKLFPSLHFSSPNNFIDFDNSSVFVNTSLKNWEVKGGVRRAGVSSFGLSGTNCHIVLEEHITKNISAPSSEQSFPIKVSAKTQASLIANLNELHSFLLQNKSIPLADFCYTLNKGRKDYYYRFAAVVSSAEELIDILSQKQLNNFSKENGKHRDFIFVFSDDSPVNSYLCEAYCNTYPLFKFHFNEIISHDNIAADERISKVAFQYAFYKLLDSKGISTTHLVGDGLGKIAISLVTNKISISEGVRQCKLYQKNDSDAKMESRCRNLISRFSDTACYIEIGPGGNIIAEISRIKYENDGKFDVMVLDVSSQSFNTLVKDLYLANFRIDWKKFYQPNQFHKIEIPTYRFDSKPCWIAELPEENFKDSLFTLEWEKVQAVDSDKFDLKGSVHLLLTQINNAYLEPIVADLHQRKGTSVVIEVSDEFKKIDQWNYQVSPTSEEDFNKLRVNILSDFSNIGGILNLCATTDNDFGNHNTTNLVDAHFLIVKTFSDFFNKKDFIVSVVSCDTLGVLENEYTKPSSAMLHAFQRGLLSDFPTSKITSVDCDQYTLKQQTSSITSLLFSDDIIRFHAFRNGGRYVQKILPFISRNNEHTKNPIARDGVYIITGGCTGIGVEIAKYLVGFGKCHFIFTGRTEIPDRAHWATVNVNRDKEIARRISALTELEKLGATAEYHAVDVADASGMQLLFGNIKSRFKKIHGVVHSAGVGGEGRPINDTSLSSFAETLSPKVKGTIVLEKNVRGLDPEFFVLFSSLNAIVPQKHSVDYAVANAFLDFVAKSHLSKETKMTVINWPAWGEVGMAVQNTEANEESHNVNVIATDKGIRIFEYVLKNDIRSVLSTEKELLERFMSNPFFLINTTSGNEKVEATGVSSNVRLIENVSSTEHVVLTIWYDVLKADFIDVTNDFFEIGGHSLLATQVINRVQKELGVQLELEHIFEHGTVSALATFIDKLKSTAAQTAVNFDIPVAPVQASYPVSFSQNRFWILSQFEESLHAYYISGALLFEGPLDKTLLINAIKYVVARHESLRTVFRTDAKGEVRQYILPPEESPVLLDYTDISENKYPEKLLQRFATEEQLTTFDLEKGPLLKSKLARVKDGLHAFYFTMHHIISDGWSMEVLKREVIGAYNALKQNQQPRFADLSIQYKDYVLWQHSQLSSDTQNLHEAYWLHQLSGELPILDIPSDHVRPGVKTHYGKSYRRSFPTSILGRLRQLCLNENSTLFMGLLAGLKVLFYKYTSQEDIILGTPIAGRDHHQLEDQIGLYLNTLALRTRFSGMNSFYELLQKERQVLLDAYAHQIYPFDQIVKKLRLERDTSRSALFDVMVVLQNQANVKLNDAGGFEGLVISGLEDVQRITSQFDLEFSFLDEGEELHLLLTYNADIFSEKNIEMLCGHFEQVLDEVISMPEKPLKEINYLTVEENSYLSLINTTQAEFPISETLVGLFESQVEHSPAKVAVVFEDRTLTYHELNLQANKLAHYMRETYAIMPDDRIGLLADRSEFMIIALMAILKSGAAYVPIDPEYPEERKQYIIKNAAIKLLVLDNDTQLTDKTGINCFFADSDWEILNLLPQANPTRICGPRHLAYVIYTSGSTGMPKGVMVEHAGVVNRIDWMWKKYDFNDKDVIFQKTPFVFDVSVWELFMTLCFGARMVLCKRDVIFNPFLLANYIHKYGITALHFVPSMLTTFIHALDDEAVTLLENVKRIFTSGEALSAAVVKKYHEYLSIPLHNLYGPTEASVDVTYYEVKKGDIIIPIGKPIANIQIYILGLHGNVLPIRFWGEICIGGIGVARGYFANATLTAERFLENPFRLGEKMYKTGDIGRWLEDGNIEFLGRTDHQVKIRGYRIELGEIESALLRITNVSEAAVVAREDKHGVKYLVGYVVMSDYSVNEIEIRDVLGKILPEYMIPSFIVFMEQFPLTTSGKLDRKALPEPYSFKATKSLPVEPSEPNSHEEKLIQIFLDVLGVRGIHRNSNFFDNGGHSLNAVQMISRIHKIFGVKLGLHHLFLHPVVKDLAGVIASSFSAKFEPITPAKVSDYFNLSHAQKGIWLLSQNEAGRVAYNISHSYHFEGKLEVDVLEESFRTLVSRHQILQTVFVEQHGEPVQKIHTQLFDFFSIIKSDISQLDGKEDALKNIRKDEASTVFDLENGPLYRIHLVRIDEQRTILVFTIHHLICDGWSLELLMEELIQLYNAYKNELTNPLPALKLQYKDYSVWEKQLLSDNSLDRLRSFWKKYFNGSLRPVNLGTGKARSDARHFKGGTFTFSMEEEIRMKLRELEKEHQVTLYVLLLSIFNVFLAKISREEEITVLGGSAGRDHIDLEKMVGVFVRTFGLKNFPKANVLFTEFLQEVKQRSLDVFKNDMYPFEKVLDDLDKENHHKNYSNVYFQLDNFEATRERKNIQIEDLSVVPIPNEAGTSKTDLMLWVIQHVDQLLITFEYDRDLFAKEKIQLWATWFNYLVRQIVANPKKSLIEYRLNSGNEKELYQYLDQRADEFESIFPLSHRQKDFYLNCKILPNECAHRVVFYTVSDARIDHKKWLETLGLVYDACPSLRTQLIEKDEEIYQAVRIKPVLETYYLDRSASHLSGDSLKAELEKFAEIDHSLQRNLASHFLIKINEDQYVNLLSVHHVISDVTSSVIFFNKFHEFYNQQTIERSLKKNVYQDFVYESLYRFDTREVMDYWRGKLKNVEPFNAKLLTTNRDEEKNIEKSIIITPEYFSSIQEYCRRQGISEALFFRAVYALLIRIYTASNEDFTINDILHGRSAATKDVFGCFTVILPLVYERDFFRGSIDGYLQKLRIQKKEIGDRQHASIFLLNQLLHRQQVKFFYNYQVLYNVKGSDVSQHVRVIANFGKDEIQFSIRDTPEGLSLILNYNSAFFNDNKFLERFKHISDQILAGTNELNKINFILPDENEVWNIQPDQIECSADKPIHVLFEEQAQRTPDRIAVTFEDTSLTYRELNEQSNQLAYHLRIQCAIKADDLIGLVAERSERMIIALLAILKSGGAYVPIDPSYPVERKNYIIENSGLKALLTDSNNGDHYAESITHISLKDDWELIKRQPKANLLCASGLNNLAYVIYTSGSTGKPKGAMLEHGGVVNRIEWMWKKYNFTAADVIFQKTPFVFDVSVWELFMPICFGARMILCNRDVIYDPVSLIDHIAKYKITTVHFVPSMFSAFIDALDEHNIPKIASVRHIFTSGEALLPETIRKYHERVDVTVHNLYGPTEASVDVSYYEVKKGDEVIPIGRPISNIQLYVVGSELQLLPVGCSGEICIGGVGLARGYLNNAELTAEKFVNNSFLPGTKFYKTGDLGRWLPDGNIEYLGRIDQQVKIRGFRIELGEIENTLLGHEKVREAVVAVKSQVKDGTKYLVAYLIPHRDIKISDVRDYLNKILPEYMIPAYFVILDQLPLTYNGKLDRKALLEIKDDYTTFNRDYVAPRNALEKKIVEIWEEVLEKESIGITDNFFEIGGNSLKVMQLTNRINKSLNIRLELRDLFAAPTIEKLNLSGNPVESVNGQIHIFGKKMNPHFKNIFFIPPLGGVSYYYLDLIKNFKENVNSFLLNLRGIFDDEPPLETIEDLISDYVRSIKLYINKDTDVFLFGYSIGGPMIFEIGNHLKKEGFKIKLFMLDSVPFTGNNLSEKELFDKQSFVEQLFPEVENFKTQAAILNVQWDKYTDAVFNFRSVLTRYVQSHEVLDADLYLFVANEKGENLEDYQKWSKYIDGALEVLVLPEGNHETILNYESNISMLTQVITDVMQTGKLHEVPVAEQNAGLAD